MSIWFGQQLNDCIRNAHLPEDCFLCGAKCKRRTLCEACRGRLPRLPLLACPQCALPTLDGNHCGRCLKSPPFYETTAAPLDYRFPTDRLILGFKYGRNLALLPILTECLIERLADTLAVDTVVPMPLSPGRLRERGFNQALEIAKHLCEALGLGLKAETCRKIRDSWPQAALPWGERPRNVRGAFVCDFDLSGQSVAIVDDVMTSGATMNELARVLRKAGASHVSAWAVARAVPETLRSR